MNFDLAGMILQALFTDALIVWGWLWSTPQVTWSVIGFIVLVVIAQLARPVRRRRRYRY